MSDDDSRIERRAWLAGASAASVAATLGSGCGVREPSGDAPGRGVHTATLVGTLRAGNAVGRWTLVAVHPARHGALPVVIAAADGARYQVDIMARDPAGALGVANTNTVSLYVVNRGDGATPTDEDQGLGAIALAQAIAEQQAAGETLPELSTFAERAARHPDGAFAVPLG